MTLPVGSTFPWIVDGAGESEGVGGTGNSVDVDVPCVVSEFLERTEWMECEELVWFWDCTRGEVAEGILV